MMTALLETGRVSEARYLNVMTTLLETGRVKLGYAEGSPECDDCPQQGE